MMTGAPLQFLLVDDDRSDRGLVKRFLRKQFTEPEIREVETREQFLAAISEPTDLIISDYLLRGFTGLEVLEILRHRRLDIPVVLLTGTGNEEVAIEAMKMGAADYVIKSMEHIRRLPATVEQALRLKQSEIDRRAAEEELLLSDQILNSMPDAVLLTDLNGRIVRWTGRAEQVFGYTALEVVGKSHSMLRRSPAESEADIPEDRSIEADCRKKDGTCFPAEITHRFLHDRSGAAQGSVWVCRDITRRKRMEEELREHTERLGALVEQRTRRIEELQRQKAAMEKLAATGQMAARIAHEINNPLAGIKNAFTLIRREIPSGGKSLSYVELIQREIDRIAAIIHQMYKTYSPKAGRPTTFHLDSAVVDVCRLLASRGQQNGVTLAPPLSDRSIPVHLPEGEVNQILYNLILNAIQASPNGGVVKIALATEASRLQVKVADTGSGIPPELRTRIFEPFFTTKSSGAQSGLGLGLAVSQNLAHAMGGRIEVESNPGGGSIFTLDLPITQGTEEGVPEA